MQARRPILGAVGALAVAAIVLPSAWGAAMPYPLLTQGDAWKTSSSFEFGDAKVTTTTESEVIGRVPRQQTGIAEDVLEIVTLELTGSEGGSFALSTSSRTTDWVRAHDGALLRSVMNTTTNVSRQGLVSESITTYEAPCVRNEWPLEVGASWTVDCVASTDGSAPQTVRETVRVVREEDVTVPAGTFRAFVLERSTPEAEEPTLEWWASEACGLVKREEPNPYEGPPIVLTLDEVACRSHGRAAPQPAPPTTTPPVASTPATPTPASGPVPTPTPTPEESRAPVPSLAPLAGVLVVATLAAWRGRRSE